MDTNHLIIICLTVVLAMVLFTLLPFLAKLSEIKQKIKIEQLRTDESKEKNKFLDDKKNLKNELETSIKESFNEDISKLVNDKIDATLTERIKTLEEQIKLLAIKPKNK